MSDIAFPPDQFAFPTDQGNDADEAQARNQQIQQAFDAQRFQRASAQNVSKALSGQAAEIAQLRRAQQKT